MISAKAAALCLCPAVAAPTVLATQPAVRHAVAHVMHRAADRLDHSRPAHSVVSKAPICTPAPGALPASAATAGAPETPVASGGGQGTAGLDPAAAATATGITAPAAFTAAAASLAALRGDARGFGSGIGAGTGGALSGSGAPTAAATAAPEPSAGQPGVAQPVVPQPVVALPVVAQPIVALTPEPIASTAGVPEPESWALLVIGFAVTGVAFRARRTAIAARRAAA